MYFYKSSKSLDKNRIYSSTSTAHSIIFVLSMYATIVMILCQHVSNIKTIKIAAYNFVIGKSAVTHKKKNILKLFI